MSQTWPFICTRSNSTQLTVPPSLSHQSSLSSHCHLTRPDPKRLASWHQFVTFLFVQTNPIELSPVPMTRYHHHNHCCLLNKRTRCCDWSPHHGHHFGSRWPSSSSESSTRRSSLDLTTSRPRGFRNCRLAQEDGLVSVEENDENSHVH